jgi:ABC-type dipeptide/oligopeptide/nickel transport system permease component
MKPWLFILSPFIFVALLAYVCGWAKAYDSFKKYDDTFELIMMTLTSAFGFLCAYGIYLLFFPQ